MDGVFMRKWELSLMFALFFTLVWYAVIPHPMWWTTAFSPLCDGILTAEGTGEIVLRSKLWEAASALIH